MRQAHIEAIVSWLADYDRVVEVGIGNRTAVADGLVQAGVDVTATDIKSCSVPTGVRFERDDITQPDHSIYEGVDAIYARNLPPELHRQTRDLARAVDAEFLFTTLGGDQPTVPVHREQLPADTLFVATF